ncbi:MAG: FMN-binding protein [Longicatena sp.]
MKKIIHLTVFLALIAALAGAALGFANSMTAPVIAANELEAEKVTLKKIYPDGKFEKVEENVSKTIQKIFKVEGKGYIFKMKVSGYKDGTSFLVALKADGTIQDYVAISNGDTSGIGTKVTEDAFATSLKGKDATNKALEEDTITGATISSKPVILGIQEAAKYQADHLK